MWSLVSTQTGNRWCWACMLCDRPNKPAMETHYLYYEKRLICGGPSGLTGNKTKLEFGE